MRNNEFKRKSKIAPNVAKLQSCIDEVFNELTYKMLMDGLPLRTIQAVTENQSGALSVFLSDHSDVTVSSYGIMNEIDQIIEPKVIAHYILQKLFGNI